MNVLRNAWLTRCEANILNENSLLSIKIENDYHQKNMNVSVLSIYFFLFMETKMKSVFDRVRYKVRENENLESDYMCILHTPSTCC